MKKIISIINDLPEELEMNGYKDKDAIQKLRGHISAGNFQAIINAISISNIRIAGRDHWDNVRRTDEITLDIKDSHFGSIAYKSIW